MVDPREHRADEVGPEALLVQAARDKVRERLRADVALLTQPVHVDFVAEEVGHGAHVGGEAREPEVERGCVGEDFREVVGYGEGLQAEAQVAGDGDAVAPDHGHAGAAVDVEGGALGRGGLVGWEGECEEGS